MCFITTTTTTTKQLLVRIVDYVVIKNNHKDVLLGNIQD